MIPPDPADPLQGSGLTDPGPTEPVAPTRPGATTFTIEGRAAPGLFVVGWLATIVGAVTAGVSFLSDQAVAPVLLLIGLVILSIGLIAGAGAQGIERRRGGTFAYAGPSPILVFAAAIPVSLLAVVAIGIPLTLLAIDVLGPVGRLASVAVQSIVYVGLIGLLVVGPGSLSWTEMGISGPVARAASELLRGAVWALPVIVATVPVALIMSLLFQATPESPLPPTGDDAGFVVQFLAGAIIAPIGEEIMFRGFATTAWARSLGHGRAIIRGALFFAFIHVLGVTGASAGEALSVALIAFATRIPVGIALGWLFLRSGSIWTPIGLHSAFNATLLVIAEAAVRSGAAA